MSKDDSTTMPSDRQAQPVLSAIAAAAAAAAGTTTVTTATWVTTDNIGSGTTALTASLFAEHAAKAAKSFPGGISEVSFDGDHHVVVAAVHPRPSSSIRPTATSSSWNEQEDGIATSSGLPQLQPKQQSHPASYLEEENSHDPSLAFTPRVVSADQNNGTTTRTGDHQENKPTGKEEEGTSTPPKDVDDDDFHYYPREQRSQQGQHQHDDSLITSPIGTVDAAYFLHSESVASDLSSSSAERANNHGGGNPTTTLSPSHHRDTPPAPPSTPASSHASLSMSFDSGMMLEAIGGPPTLGSMMADCSYRDTTRTLEEQQQRFLAAAEAMTPLPPRSGSATTPGGSGHGTDDVASAPKLPTTDDFSDWAVGDRYELIRILGRGSYGEVAQAVDTQARRHNRSRQRDDDDDEEEEEEEEEEEITYVAIKRIQSPFDQQVDAVRLYREIHILRQMQAGTPHQCLIQLLDVVQPPTDDLDDFHDLYLVFEYADTDLHKLILSPQYLTTAHIQTFLYQMLAGLKYIHSCSVIHRDLKPANILLNEDCSLKICDFGLARIVDRDAISSTTGEGAKRKGVVDPTITPNKRKRARTGQLPGPPVPKNLTRQLTKHVVTRWYRAPELILIQPYTSAVDIWSLGCIFAELLGMQAGNVPGYADRKPLFPGGTCYPLSGEGGNIKSDDRLDQLSVIFSVIGTPSKEDIMATGRANEYIESLPYIKAKSLAEVYPEAEKNAINLLEQMLRFNPHDRVTAEDALEHDFFRGVRKKEELERSALQPLAAPAFLEAEEIDLRCLKEKIYNEVLWYRDCCDTITAAGQLEDSTPNAPRSSSNVESEVNDNDDDDIEAG